MINNIFRTIVSWLWKLNKLHVTNVLFEKVVIRLRQKAYSRLSSPHGPLGSEDLKKKHFQEFLCCFFLLWGEMKLLISEAGSRYLLSNCLISIQGQKQLKVDQASIQWWGFFWKNTNVCHLEFTVGLWEEIKGPWATHKQEIWSLESRPGQAGRMTKQTTVCILQAFRCLYVIKRKEK